MAINNLHELSKEQLSKRVIQLEASVEMLLEEKRQNDFLKFPWIGNLGHWYWDFRSNTVEFNDKKITTLGYTLDEIPDEVGHQFFTEKLHPEDYDYVMNNMSEHLEGKTDAYEVEYRIKAKDGKYLWYYDRGIITKRDENGAPIMVAGIVFDITKSKNFEETLMRTNKRLKVMATTDELTGILNRRTIMYKLRAHIMREKCNFSLVMFDVDFFKKINDTFGHTVGDEVLKAIANTVKGGICEKSYFGRWGGEEFLLLLPVLELNGAVALSENLRREIVSLDILTSHKISASFGVVEYENQETIDQIITRVDELMYKAKENGRNRIEYK